MFVVQEQVVLRQGRKWIVVARFESEMDADAYANRLGRGVRVRMDFSIR